MTTKPKARKFRIRRTEPTTPAPQSGPAPAPRGDAPASARPGVVRPSAPAAQEGAPQQPPQFQSKPQPAQEPQAQPAPQGMVGQTDSPRQVSAEDQIDAIRREGLTGRQLRMARRVAQKHGLPATSDFDAVRLLRAEGIDPFQRSNMLELVVDGDGNQTPPTDPKQTAPEPQAKVQLPQTIKTHRNLPSTEQMSPAERRSVEIMQIQRDIAKRRRRKLALLLTRLAFFVFIPTAITGYYFYNVATPLYATKSEFLIIKNETSGSAVGGLLSGTQWANSQDAIAVQSYLESKDAMLRLDEDEGFRAHFTQDWIDPIQRMDPDPSTEEAYKIYKRNVTIGYDPTEGVIRMEVAAVDPQVAADFNAALLSYAEERVDNLSSRMRQNSLADAERFLEDAKAERRAAQERLVRMQQDGAVLDPEGRIGALRAQISQYEIELQNKELELQAQLDNRRPNQAKVDGARGDIRRLEALLERLQNEMTQAREGEDSLAEMAANIQLAQSDLANADLVLQSAMDQLQSARREAVSQSRYLTTSVKPVPPQDPSYPRKFENTVLAFLIFAGIYLMMSITASILREQVSS